MIKYLAVFYLVGSALGNPVYPRQQYNSYPFPFILRESWGANPPRSITNLTNPAAYVVIHHTYIPRICLTWDVCMQYMRSMQNTHQNINEKSDIGYNFAVGGEGLVYEGRGWEVVGEHAGRVDSLSIGIALIGDFVSQLPPAISLHATKLLISEGVERGYIRPDYQLIGHRQVVATECPGEALFQEIQTWDQFSNDEIRDYPFLFVTREAWGANPPRSVTNLTNPAAYVVIHHTYIPGICLTRNVCMQYMRSMQNTHQNTNGWSDFRYSFAVGGEGSVYEGRGWETIGDHADRIDPLSIGIALIGDFVSQLPPAIALQTTQQLISEGVKRGYIRPDYQLIGHRQVVATECPGEALFQEIQTWDQFSNDEIRDYPFLFVTREAWGANPPRSVTNLTNPAVYVVIHHTYIPGICLTRNQCMQYMRSMQNTHQNTNGWSDFRYSFAVGGEGSVYEGRGWEVVGDHADRVDSMSIGIALIGDFVSQLPPAIALQTTQQLISEGVKRGYIRPDYQLIGHRQVVATECPGDALFQEIQTWDQFSNDEIRDYPFPFVTREAWGANLPRSVTNLTNPAAYVVIHHTYIPGICLTRNQCMQYMRSMQNTHQNTNGWSDFRYSFAVGGEGSVYEGRGWEVVGDHADRVDSMSIGIALIGDFVSQLPPAIALQSTQQLISEGVKRGYIRPDYQLIGHRQVVATECPGDALFQEIQTWEQFSNDEIRDYPFPFVTREAWGANLPRSVTNLTNPAAYVVIHHTYIPGICLTRDVCMQYMRSMQNTHQNMNGWSDFRYSFAVGGEGSVYEGRGWEVVGDHADRVDSMSIGIALIGDFVSQIPPAIALQTTQQLISEGVKRGYIRPDYQLIGHRQVVATECPGDALFQEIQTWEQFSNDEIRDYPFPFVTREAWGANPPRSVTNLTNPAAYVVIHHTYIPGICLTRNQCMQYMRSMQNTHQNTNGWSDFRYSFAVGGEGSVYEGRGWETVGDHADRIDPLSIGISLIGDFVSQLPPAIALQTTQQLISEGVKRGYIRPDYQLIGHRQVVATECPGEALFQEIQTWDHFSNDEINEYPFPYVTREDWGANPPRFITKLSSPATYVVIHHTYIPRICLTVDLCMQYMRSMQNTHQNTNGRSDIGYNFAVGGEGSVYEGRGWEVVGEHAGRVDSLSIGIALIGDFVSQLPPAIVLQTTRQLISEGVRRGYIRPDYQLIGHRQVVATECPGEALFQEIRTWDHFSNDVVRAQLSPAASLQAVKHLISESV